MKFYSTKRQAPEVNLKEAVLKSLPADKGLYMPEQIAQMPSSYWEQIGDMTFQEAAYQLVKSLLKDCIPDDKLQQIVYDTLNFEAPLKQLEDNLYCLELFHGPSLAFKDFGARFMARLMSYLVGNQEQTLDILVATSGDTGGAVALGFYNTPNINVTILYPSGKVSMLQEKQLTTLGGNIQALEVNGTFDDCQSLVKQAFLDQDLNDKLLLSSANSINIARLVPQSFYYLRAYQQIKDKSQAIAMCVPSGNFGNITAGIIAKKMGLPIPQFIAANNKNEVFKKYWETGKYEPHPSYQTVSNAMDVGNPSNFQRLMDIYQNDLDAVKKDIWACSFTDEQTIEAIGEIYQKYQYLVCPHTAVAYLGAKAFEKEHSKHQIIFQATAHPSKFIDIVEETTKTKVELPEQLNELIDRKKEAIQLDVDFDKFKNYLLSK